MGWTVITDGKRNCILCGAQKPLADFCQYKYTTMQGKRSVRHSSRCKECEKVRMNAAYYGDRETHIARASSWQSRNPESKRASYHKRRSAEGSFTPADVAVMLDRQRGKCAYCRLSFRGKHTVDHITPLALGGTNWPRNLQLTCRPCNTKKNAKDPIDWARSLGLLA